jgi:PKD repeat protein
MFTQGQAARMQLALQNTIAGRNNLWTNANLIATGVISPAGPCVPVADFKSNRVKTCSGAPVTFKDASWNGQPLNYYWSFPGGTPAISTASAPVVTYANPGNYAVTYSVSNAAGTSTPVTKTGYINVTSGAAAYSGAWTEGFESGVIPNGDWQTASSSGAVYWVSTALASYSGAVSAYIPRENNTRKTITSMTGPLVNISGISNPALSFKVANGDGSTHTNTLQVHVSTDCGTTWSQVYSKWGTALVTSASTNTDFIPASRSEWRTEVISLSAYASSSALNVRFTYIRDTMPGANNTFIDNINIDGGASVAESSAEELLDYAVFPNPSQGDLQIAFSLLTPQKITLSVYDINGKLVLSKPNADALAGRNVLSLKGNDLATGLYLLQLEIGQKRFCKKLAIE